MKEFLQFATNLDSVFQPIPARLICQARGTGLFLILKDCQGQAAQIENRQARVIFPDPTGNPALQGVHAAQKL